MEESNVELRDLNPLRPLHHFRTRLLLFALGVAVAAALTAGLAFAKTRATPIGTGVVVIDTNLAYQGARAAGTGMVLTSSGEVLTNNHVIRGATTIKIVVPGTGHSYKARVIGYDLSGDAAVLQARGASNLKPISLGNSAQVKVGQRVRAVGNAGGTGSLSRASGRVTAVPRAITVNNDQGGTEHLEGLIKTNAALQPGDSGGPLLNTAGKVIGMDTAASANFVSFQLASSGDGYAIPINRAVAIAERIESGKGSTTIHIGGTAFLGVEVVANVYSGSGAMVAGVVNDGPAAHAGLRPGDVITSFAGRSIHSPAKLTSIVLRENPRARVSVTYFDQSGASHTRTVTLASGPPQ